MKKKIVTLVIALGILALAFLSAVLIFKIPILGFNKPNAPVRMGMGGAGPQMVMGGQGQQMAIGGAGPQTAMGGAAPQNITVVQAIPAANGLVQNSVVITGDVLARNQVSIFPTVGGRLTQTRFGIGDRVNVGNIVAMVDPSRPGEIFSQSPVVSTVSGTVLQAPFSVGDTVSSQNALYVVGDLSSLIIETFVPERFVSAMRQGLRATISFEALPNEFFLASIEEVNPVLDPASRTLRVRLRFINQAGNFFMDPRIRAGMFATINLVTQEKANTMVIPRTSVINTRGIWIVFVVGENNIAMQREVKLGIEGEEFVEIISGLEIGELVVSAGQNFLTNGDTVRIVP